jgi:hypothetical protein
MLFLTLGWLYENYNVTGYISSATSIWNKQV